MSSDLDLLFYREAVLVPSPRYRCGGGKSQSHLTVEELRSFVRQLYNLPCSLSQAPLLKVGGG